MRRTSSSQASLEQCGGLCAAGCGGRKLSEVEHDQPSWLAYAAREWGYGRVTVRDSSELLFEFVESQSGDVADSARLFNGHSRGRMCDGLGSATSEASQSSRSNLLVRPGAEQQPVSAL